MIGDVSDRNFDAVVGSSRVPVLVEFWKPGCVLKMNVEENFQIPAELEITSLPALALYRGGQFERFIGGLGTKEEILRQLQASLRVNDCKAIGGLGG
jgi:thioredoxin